MRWNIFWVVVIVAGCAEVSVTRVERSTDGTDLTDYEGVRYFRPAPYLVVTEDKDGATSTSIAWLPDRSEEYVIDIKSGFGATDVDFSLANGWNLTGFKENRDPQIDETMTSLGGALAKLPIFGVSESDEPLPVGLYRLVFGPDGHIHDLDPVSIDLSADSKRTPLSERSPSDQFRLPPEFPGGDVIPAIDAPGVPVPSSDRLVIGSWNIKWFGNKSVNSYDFVTMADFIEECDLVAIQELTGAHFNSCLETLIDELASRGEAFVFDISDSTGYRNNPDIRKNDYEERFAYVWRPDRLDLKESGPADVPELNHDIFRQVPFVADFEVNNGNGFDFRILTVHTVYNRKINFVREDELEWVRDWLVETSQDGEVNKIAIGDFNANPPGQPSFFASIIPDDSDFRVLMYESEDLGEEPIRTTVPTKDTSTNPAYFLEPVYDHILITHDTSHALPSNPMIRDGGHMGVYDFDNDPWWDANGWSRHARIAVVSDHRPIWFKLDYFADDLDPDS